jgi:hemolysin III
LRGHIHRWFAILSVPAFIVLVCLAQSTTARIAMAIYGVGVAAMLSVSAVYHSGKLSESAQRAFRRLDHSAILLAVTGSYTAVTTLSLHGRSEVTLLVFVWTAATVGVIIRMAWLHAPSPVIASVYLLVGWSALVEIGALSAALNAIDTALLWGGGAMYSIGAVIYAAKRPNPFPRFFGFHEIFHALVAGAATVHYVLVLRLATG